jgi:hypothetical protein
MHVMLDFEIVDLSEDSKNEEENLYEGEDRNFFIRDSDDGLY